MDRLEVVFNARSGKWRINIVRMWMFGIVAWRSPVRVADDPTSEERSGIREFDNLDQTLRYVTETGLLKVYPPLFNQTCLSDYMADRDIRRIDEVGILSDALPAQVIRHRRTAS